MNRPLPALALLVAAAALPPAARAQDAQPLRDASIEALMDITVTSAGRTAQRAQDVAAAIYVITRDDILHSGLRTLPEILRLAPGVHVARASASKWAVSIRGFNDVFSNKLLILVDGRSVYNRSFSGVFWDGLDVPVDAIERIEVIRGPGGALWGANAVNGILNIITRHAADTRGVAVDVETGTLDHGRVSLRYGRTAGSLAYRVHAQWGAFGTLLTPDMADAGDRWSSFTTGTRIDWTGRRDTLMAQANVTLGRVRPQWIELLDLASLTFGPSDRPSDTRTADILARWTRTARNGSLLQVQASHAATRRDEAISLMRERATDLDAQIELPPAGRHRFVLGGQYRLIDFSADGTPTLDVASERAHVVSVFAQDTVTLHPRLTAAAGVKVERDSVSGSSVLPSARLIWRASANRRVWASVARARRTPALTDRTLRYYLGGADTGGLPLVIGFVGNPSLESETLTQGDAGYRMHLGSAIAIDIAAFYGRYDNLPTTEVDAPVLRTSPAPAHLLAARHFENLMQATTRGAELAVEWAPSSSWRLRGSYAALRLTPQVAPASGDQAARGFDGSAPRTQWQLSLSATPAAPLRVDAALYRVGALRALGIPAYTRADARVELRLGKGLSFAVAGQNLLQRAHQEFVGVTFGPTLVPRSVQAQLRWESH